jgi:hypothetical protein
MVRAHSRACALLGDAGEAPAQFDRGRELAALLERGPDRRSICVGDDKHPWSMGSRELPG